MWLATQIFLGLVAVMALGIWFLEPFGWAWRAASAIVLGTAWYLIFRLCPNGAPSVRGKRSLGDQSGGRRTREFSRPPKSARHTYVLTEGGVPVAVEYDRRAVDNWIGLGDEFEAIPHDLRRRLA